MSVAIPVDTATPALEVLKQSVSTERVISELGPRLTRLVQRHFRGLGQNSKGWHSSYFWPRAAEATNWQSDNDGLEIVCNQIGVRQRYYGGHIGPVNAKALTIPADEEAYGKTAREFSNLRLSLQKNPATGRVQACLVEAETSKIKIGRPKKDGSRSVKKTGESDGKRVLFWLVKGVNQQPNPEVIPSDAEFDAAFDKGIENLLKTA